MFDHVTKILAIDDNDQSLRLIQELLRESTRSHFEMERAQYLDDGLQLLATSDFDLILLDLSLPDSFGLQTFDRTHAAAPKIPIVILTNTDDDLTALEAMRRGAQDYVVKFDLDGRLLARSIRYAIERQRVSDEVRQLQTELTKIALAEQRRIGQELHDGLGQHLTGVGLMAKTLQRKLKPVDDTLSDSAGELAELIAEAAGQVRGLVRGLQPVDVDAEGLMAALKQLAQATKRMCEIECVFQCPSNVVVEDNPTATHLFRIAQEAVNNSVKHSQASQIVIQLEREADRIKLKVEDDGVGFDPALAQSESMGLRIMQYRANMIGASLEIDASQTGGARVSCTFYPSVPRDEESSNDHKE